MAVEDDAIQISFAFHFSRNHKIINKLNLSLHSRDIHDGMKGMKFNINGLFASLKNELCLGACMKKSISLDTPCQFLSSLCSSFLSSHAARSEIVQLMAVLPNAIAPSSNDADLKIAGNSFSLSALLESHLELSSTQKNSERATEKFPREMFSRLFHSWEHLFWWERKSYFMIKTSSFFQWITQRYIVFYELLFFSK